MTCGGFEFNDEMKENYLRVAPAHFIGNPANTGDGIKMALEAGADLWHMNCASWRAIMKFPDFPLAHCEFDACGVAESSPFECDPETSEAVHIGERSETDTHDTVLRRSAGFTSIGGRQEQAKQCDGNGRQRSGGKRSHD